LALGEARQQGEAGRGAQGAIARQPTRLRLCPRCSSADYVQQEGCWVCNACGFSRCG
jgi:hypothetical protein